MEAAVATPIASPSSSRAVMTGVGKVVAGTGRGG